MPNIAFKACIQENQAVRDAYSMLSGNLYMESENKKISSIVITSSEPKAGKTSVAISLAVTLAGWGKSTVLVDADMRKEAALASIPREVSNRGLSQYLCNNAGYEEIICCTDVEGFRYIPNGGIALNPIGLICSERFDRLLESLEEEFEYAIFDAPPLDSISDAVLISAKADSAILVAKMGKTDITAIGRSKEKLEKANVNLLGVVINEINKRDYRKYLNSYGYFHSAKVKKGLLERQLPMAAK
ncbi:capsular exopolysaccharide synthesis family protein [Ruminiclostridium sufflavum DSM 19573]|uniref:non-specific protein-tyrosine kinase n=1 Tax=Ruminiclostridium sufflavum DSM 19573 TaxID=1121337 RepID=A0A318XQE5_9FIRM|nr:CpsD/CapB family tyrosine-protein kinase [Ruminiclostridium sufflavum]PYG89498.1 capsular exopolysaccharide synthesis family protein [Ruminiclostridium sufflavum DSM 19573]